jgi:carbonic anhydrase
MFRSKYQVRRREGRTARHLRVPAFEALENRTVLTASLSHQTVVPGLVHESWIRRQPVLGTIGGLVTNDLTGRGMRGVRVQLIDATGSVVQAAFTNAGGRYQFKIRQNGPYVVREVTPRNFVQLSPTFASTKPQGMLAPGYTNNSWNYKSGNNDPTNGIPVGPTSWATIAPAGNLPFESPINIQGPPVDLGRVLSINYANTAPTKEVNTGYQIQLQFNSSTADSITLGGQQFNLTQFHYHDPAENQVNGVTYPMEEHFVNLSTSGAETVVAVFLQLGPHNSALDPILNAALAHLNKTPAGTSTPGSNVGTIDFAGLLPSSLMGWFYQGSLTTPPLAQVVNWLVLATPITLDAAQLAEYQAVADGNGYLPNARPVQPLDGRQLNEVDFEENFQNQSIAGLNFVLGRATASNGSTIASAAATSVTMTTGLASTLHAQSLPILQGNPSLQATAAAQNYQPVAGCNCPLCQMLRDAAWHQVNVASIQPAAPPVASNNATAVSPAAYSSAL